MMTKVTGKIKWYARKTDARAQPCPSIIMQAILFQKKFVDIRLKEGM
jgi:hypothetical protein